LGLRLGALIPAGLAGAIGIVEIINFQSSVDEAGRSSPFAHAMAANVQIGIGLYLLIVSTIAIIVLAFVLDRAQPRW